MRARRSQSIIRDFPSGVIDCMIQETAIHHRMPMQKSIRRLQRPQQPPIGKAYSCIARRIFLANVNALPHFSPRRDRDPLVVLMIRHRQPAKVTIAEAIEPSAFISDASAAPACRCYPKPTSTNPPRHNVIPLSPCNVKRAMHELIPTAVERRLYAPAISKRRRRGGRSSRARDSGLRIGTGRHHKHHHDDQKHSSAHCVFTWHGRPARAGHLARARRPCHATASCTVV